MAARAFITGIAGFAGSHLAELLVARGDEVHGLVRPGEPTGNLASIEGRLQLATADICDLERLAEALARSRPEYVYHLAGFAATGRSFSDPLAVYRVNALGTAALFEAIRSLALRPRVLVVGSAESYGRVEPSGPIAEETPLRPVSPYGASKAAAEMIAIAAFEGTGIDTIRVRAFNHTGARQAIEFAAPAFAKQVVEAEAGMRPPTIHVGNLRTIRDVSDVRDVVRAYAALIERGRPGDVYNVGSGRGIRMADLLAMIVSRSRVRVTIVEDPSRTRPVDIPSLVASVKKLEAATGLACETPLEATIDYLLQGLRSSTLGGAL